MVFFINSSLTNLSNFQPTYGKIIIKKDECFQYFLSWFIYFGDLYSPKRETTPKPGGTTTSPNQPNAICVFRQNARKKLVHGLLHFWEICLNNAFLAIFLRNCFENFRNFLFYLFSNFLFLQCKKNPPPPPLLPQPPPPFEKSCINYCFCLKYTRKGQRRVANKTLKYKVKW